MTDPFANLTKGHFGCILADPPWSFKTWSGKTCTPHRTANDHYSTMSLASIAELPVSDLAAKDCALLMWIVDSHIDQGIDLARHWGFGFKTKALTWRKLTGNGIPMIGMGYWTRKQTEQCYLFTRGTPKRKSMGVREIIDAPRREHSRKPDEQYARIEALVDGPCLELFARTQRENWTCWGNEVGKFSGQPESGHPICDHSQLSGARVPLQVVTSPADNLDVPDDIAIPRSEAINAR